MILEAMAHSLPVVATHVGSIDEMLDDGRRGVLVAPRSPGGLADGISRVIDQPALRATYIREGYRFAKEHGVEVIRVAGDHLAMMEVRRRGEAEFVGGTRGGFIFPGFQMGADAMLSAVKLLELMARNKTRLGEARKKFEHLIRQAVSVPCPWSKKGTVMRRLIVGSDDQPRQLIDGVRVFDEDGWVLVTPDRLTAAFNILAESHSTEKTARLIEHYRTLVEESQLN